MEAPRTWSTTSQPTCHSLIMTYLAFNLLFTFARSALGGAPAKAVSRLFELHFKPRLENPSKHSRSTDIWYAKNIKCNYLNVHYNNRIIAYIQDGSMSATYGMDWVEWIEKPISHVPFGKCCCWPYYPSGTRCTPSTRSIDLSRDGGLRLHTTRCTTCNLWAVK